MNVYRRDLLRGGPAVFFGLNFPKILSAQAQNSALVDRDVVNFRVHGGMGVPANAVKELDVYDAYPGTAPGVSYITLSVGVQPAKKAAAVSK
jgi:hypothetical protein